MISVMGGHTALCASHRGSAVVAGQRTVAEHERVSRQSVVIDQQHSAIRVGERADHREDRHPRREAAEQFPFVTSRRPRSQLPLVIGNGVPKVMFEVVKHRGEHGRLTCDERSGGEPRRVVGHQATYPLPVTGQHPVTQHGLLCAEPRGDVGRCDDLPDRQDLRRPVESLIGAECFPCLTEPGGRRGEEVRVENHRVGSFTDGCAAPLDAHCEPFTLEDPEGVPDRVAARPELSDQFGFGWEFRSGLVGALEDSGTEVVGYPLHQSACFLVGSPSFFCHRFCAPRFAKRPFPDFPRVFPGRRHGELFLRPNVDYGLWDQVFPARKMCGKHSGKVTATTEPASVWTFVLVRAPFLPLGTPVGGLGVGEWGKSTGRAPFPGKILLYSAVGATFVLVAWIRGGSPEYQKASTDTPPTTSETKSGGEGSNGSSGGENSILRGLKFSFTVLAYLPAAAVILGAGFGAHAYRTHQKRKDRVLEDELGHKMMTDDGRAPIRTDWLAQPEIQERLVFAAQQGIQQTALAAASRDLVSKVPHTIHYAPKGPDAVGPGNALALGGGEQAGACPSWLELWQNREIGGSGLALGWTLNGLVGGNLTQLRSIGLLGRPGGGKTVTVAGWVGQLVSQGAQVMPADVDAKNSQGLGARIEPLWPYLWAPEDGPPVAQDEDDMRRFLISLESRWRARVAAGEDPDAVLTVIVLDEVPTAFGNKEYGGDLQDLLNEIILRGRKYNWFVILGGQDWNKEAAGGTIRDQLSTKVFHQADRGQINRFTGIMSAQLPPDATYIGQGVAYVAAEGSVQKMWVPMVERTDFEAVAAFLSDQPAGELWTPARELDPTLPNELGSGQRELPVSSQYSIGPLAENRLTGTLVSDEQVRDWVLEAGLDEHGLLAKKASADIIKRLCEAEGRMPSGNAHVRNQALLNRIVGEVNEDKR